MSVVAGKVAQVTGAAGGIGGAVVTAFTAEGARVFAVDRDVTGISPSVESFACDVTDAAQVEAAVPQCPSRFGPLNVVFNGGGIHGRRFGVGPVARATFPGCLAARHSHPPVCS